MCSSDLFFKSDEGRDFVEISMIGDPCTWIGKVRPDHVQRFPTDWAAYQAGSEQIDVGGTPITEVPGVDKNLALAYRLKGIRNAEELAALDEAAAQSLGLGGLACWKASKLLMQAKRAEALEATLAERTKRKAKEEPTAALTGM